MSLFSRAAACVPSGGAGVSGLHSGHTGVRDSEACDKGLSQVPEMQRKDTGAGDDGPMTSLPADFLMIRCICQFQ
jgi:hypothetical protein